jgi:DNA polymerase V
MCLPDDVEDRNATAQPNLRERQLITYTSRTSEKLRQHRVVARCLMVFMHTNCFNQEPWYANSATGAFVEPTSDTLQLTEMAVHLGEQI